MNPDNALRKHLAELLRGGGAHATFDEVVEGMPQELCGKLIANVPHSAWQLLEHLRIAQWDILEFTRDAKHVSPKFPDGYWPDGPMPPTQKAWEQSVERFREDLAAMIALVEDEKTDLYRKIPHGDGQTVVREALVLADHNSYHLGELVLLRRALGAWKK